MIDNETLKTIRERRSIRRFGPDPVSDDLLEAVLEAGRWAPSGLNSQPWEFVVVRDPSVRAEIASLLQRITVAWRGFAVAPAMIVVAVDPKKDPGHFVEDGAVAAQNLCLAACSLGLASSWAGVYRAGSRRRSVEQGLRSLLGLPGRHRVVAVIPIGFPAADASRSRRSRRPLEVMTHYDRYGGYPADRQVGVGG